MLDFFAILKSSWCQYDSLICRLRILSKFLSFIECLPYYKCLQAQTANDAMKEIIKSRSRDKPILDLEGIVRMAVKTHNLVITLPWIIEYCSMLDPISIKMNYVQDLFKELIRIYKFVLTPQKNLVCSRAIVDIIKLLEHLN